MKLLLLPLVEMIDWSVFFATISSVTSSIFLCCNILVLTECFLCCVLSALPRHHLSVTQCLHYCGVFLCIFLWWTFGCEMCCSPRFAPGAPVFSSQSKHMRVGLITHSKACECEKAFFLPLFHRGCTGVSNNIKGGFILFNFVMTVHPGTQ